MWQVVLIEAGSLIQAGSPIQSEAFVLIEAGGLYYKFYGISLLNVAEIHGECINRWESRHLVNLPCMPYGLLTYILTQNADAVLKSLDKLENVIAELSAK